MKWILAVIMTVGMAFFWNGFLRCSVINALWRIRFLIPLGEEVIKYYVAFFLHLSPLWVGLVFGLGEGIYEALHIKKNPGWVSVLAAAATHLFFGTGYLVKGLTWNGLALSVALHSLWNIAMTIKS